MNKEQFIDLVTSHILEYLPKEYKDARVEVMERTKNNDTLLHGLIIHSGEKKEMEAAPIFYLEPYFDAYRFGEKDMEDVMHDLARDYLQVIRNMLRFDLPDMTKEGIREKVYLNRLYYCWN